VGGRARASAVRAEVVAALDDWAGIAGDGPRRAWLLAVARAADPDPERDRLRQPELWRDKAALARLAREARVAELSPQLAAALGRALLRNKGDAVPLLREAQARYPHDFWLNFELGRALFVAKERDEAIGYYCAALALRPSAAAVHNDLGSALYDRGKREEAIRHFEEALRLDPKLAGAHNNLGNALYAKGKLAEAVGPFEQALRLDPKYAQAHVGLGLALYGKGRLDEAVGHYQEALRIDPKYAQAHGALGEALLALGRWAEARDATRRCLDLWPQRHPLRALVTRQLHRQLQQCERMLALEPRLPAVLAVKDRPASAAECLDFAALCRSKKQYAAAARFYADAFAADPKLADDLGAFHRYAACLAALAAAGKGTDAPQPDAKERARLRRQALDWLRADLALWAKQLEQNTPPMQAEVQRILRHWQQDPDLVGVRDAAALTKLPEAERADWQKLWADVAALLKKAEASGKN
jgi:tetratricopeptide (TPR) repeat protein